MSPCNEERSALLGSDETHRVVEIRPTRLTPKGHTRSPDYLFGFNYPPILGRVRSLIEPPRKPTITTTADPARALRYDGDPEVLESAMLLLAAIGYPDAKVVRIRTTH